MITLTGVDENKVVNRDVLYWSNAVPDIKKKSNVSGTGRCEQLRIPKPKTYNVKNKIDIAKYYIYKNNMRKYGIEHPSTD